jgi:hypothetical protein
VGLLTHRVSTVSFIILRLHDARYTGLGLSRCGFVRESGAKEPDSREYPFSATDTI